MLHLKPLFHFTIQKRQHHENLGVTSDVVFSCCWCPSAGADSYLLARNALFLPLFSKDFMGSVGIKIFVFLVGFPCPFFVLKQKGQGRTGWRDPIALLRSQCFGHPTPVWLLLLASFLFWFRIHLWPSRKLPNVGSG